MTHDRRLRELGQGRGGIGNCRRGQQLGDLTLGDIASRQPRGTSPRMREFENRLRIAGVFHRFCFETQRRGGRRERVGI